MPYMEKDDVIKELIKVSERLAEKHWHVNDYSGTKTCIHCDGTDYDWTIGAPFGARLDDIDHSPDCPIVLHRQLMKLLGVAN